MIARMAWRKMLAAPSCHAHSHIACTSFIYSCPPEHLTSWTSCAHRSFAYGCTASGEMWWKLVWIYKRVKSVTKMRDKKPKQRQSVCVLRERARRTHCKHISYIYILIHVHHTSWHTCILYYVYNTPSPQRIMLIIFDEQFICCCQPKNTNAFSVVVMGIAAYCGIK